MRKGWHQRTHQRTSSQGNSFVAGRGESKLSKEILDDYMKVLGSEWSIEAFTRAAKYADNKRQNDSLSDEAKNQWAYLAVVAALQARGLKREFNKAAKLRKRPKTEYFKGMDKTQIQELKGERRAAGDPEWYKSDEEIREELEMELDNSSPYLD
jgi:hypothetical protein